MNNIKRSFLCLCMLLCALSLLGEEKPDALALYNQKKYAESAQICLKEIQETPKNMDSYIVLGWALLGQKKYSDAAKYAEMGMKVSRYDPRNLFTAAEAYYYIGENKKALKYLEEYAQIANKTTDKRLKHIYYFMGEIYIRKSEYSSADMAFSTALHYDNKVADWWARLGYAREMSKNYEWALEAYENALKLEPNHPEAKRGKNNVEHLLG